MHGAGCARLFRRHNGVSAHGAPHQRHNQLASSAEAPEASPAWPRRPLHSSLAASRARGRADTVGGSLRRPASRDTAPMITTSPHSATATVACCTAQLIEVRDLRLHVGWSHAQCVRQRDVSGGGRGGHASRPGHQGRPSGSIGQRAATPADLRPVPAGRSVGSRRTGVGSGLLVWVKGVALEVDGATEPGGMWPREGERERGGEPD